MRASVSRSYPRIERLRELLEYDETSPSGLRWRISRRGVKNARGKIAGCQVMRSHLPYWQVRVDRRLFYSHQIVWALATGNWPQQEVDHVDGRQNKIANLRLATRQQQSANSRRNTRNTSGFKGVSWDKRKRKWRAYIVVNQHQIFLGYFEDKMVAARMYTKCAKHVFNKFARPA